MAARLSGFSLPGPVQLRFGYPHGPAIFFGLGPLEMISAPIPEYSATEDHKHLIAGAEIAVPSAVPAEHAAQSTSQFSHTISSYTEFDECPKLRLAGLRI